MSAQPRQEPAQDPLAISEEEIDAVLHEAKGDPREAIRNVLRDLAVLASDADAATSRGFLRGRFSAGARPAAAVEEL